MATSTLETYARQRTRSILLRQWHLRGQRAQLHLPRVFVWHMLLFALLIAGFGLFWILTGLNQVD
jgi:hypothetical protein